MEATTTSFLHTVFSFRCVATQQHDFVTRSYHHESFFHFNGLALDTSLS